MRIFYYFQHFKHLSDNLDAVLASTSKNNEDFCVLNEVANTLHKSCRKIFSSHSSSRSAASVSSKASRSSQRSRSSTRSQRSCQSTSSQGSIDSEVLDIQNRLAASKDSQVNRLCYLMFNKQYKCSIPQMFK